MPVSGRFRLGQPDDAYYKLWVPNGATVNLTASVDYLTKDFEGIGSNWSMIFNVDPFGFWGLGRGNDDPGPYYDQQSSISWTNHGLSREVDVRVWRQYAGDVTWRLTATLSIGGANPPCTLLSPYETLGPNCAVQNSAAIQGLYGDPVNAATGNFHEAFVDFDIPGRGPGLVFSHSYNSLQAGVDGPLGFGWTHTYAVSLSEDPVSRVVTVSQESGAKITFYPVGSGYEAPPRVRASLTKNANGTYTLVRCHFTTLSFATTGQLTSIADRLGNSTTLSYSAGKLSTVTEGGTNRKLSVGWTGNRITSVTDDTGRTVRFGYNDGAGNLTDYTDAGGAAWRFTYNLHRLETLRRPRQAGLANPRITTNVYDNANRVTSQTDELDRRTTFEYTSAQGIDKTKVTDPKGNVVVEEYKDYALRSRTLGIWPNDPKWLIETDATLGITKLTDPNGHVTVATYDSEGNRTRRASHRATSPRRATTTTDSRLRRAT